MFNPEDFRDWHYLRPLKASGCPTSVMFLDTETVGIQDAKNKRREYHHLHLWVAKYERWENDKWTRTDIASGGDANGFWRFLESKVDSVRTIWLFANNLGFDATVLEFWRMALEGRIEFVQYQNSRSREKASANKPKWLGCAIVDDPPIILKFRFKGTKKTVCCVDAFNYFRTSLEEIGESIGMGKGEQPPKSAPFQAWLDYCIQDVLVLEKAIKGLIDLVRGEGLGKFALTISSQAMSAYRCKFMPSPKSILVHGNDRAIWLERQSYHSGAVHTWYIGKVKEPAYFEALDESEREDGILACGPVYHLDVQSFYPSIMAQNKMPARLLKVILAPSPDQVRHAMSCRGVIADCLIDCEEPGFPVTREGRTFYAQGLISTVLCGPELKRALEEAKTVKIRSMAVYEMDDLFSDFVNYFWELRKKYAHQGNKAFAYVCKLLMNSLYGKFGQWDARWKNQDDTLAPIPFGHWWERKADGQTIDVFRSLAWLPQLQTGKVEHRHSCPAISSYITSYGRERILDLARVAGVHNCFYSDTDSLHVNYGGLFELSFAGEVKSGEMGKLIIKDKGETAEYRGVKNYTLGTTRVIAGIHEKAMQISPKKYEQIKFARLGSILQSEQLDGVAVERIIISEPKRQLIGSVDPQGRFHPPVLCEW